jgi:hypothetical protein
MVENDVALFTAFEEAIPDDPASSEKHLMLAILKTAADDLKRSGSTQRDSYRYLMSNDREYLFSFLNVCEQLNICPIQVRECLGLKINKNELIRA